MSVRYKIPQILRRYFVPQQDDFSCAVASMATISQICSKEYDYDYWLNLLNPSPETGTSQIKLEETVGVLGVCKAGCFIYEDGLAIANITMMPDNEGHYVVLLGREGDYILYYCPYDDVIYKEQISKIVWKSENEGNEGWSINFMAPFSRIEKIKSILQL